MASIVKRGSGFQVKWRDPDGRQRARSCPDLRTAQKLQRDVARTVAEGRRWSPADAVALPRIAGEEGLVEAYLLHRRRTKAPKTLEREISILGQFSDWLVGRFRGRVTSEVLCYTLLGEWYDFLGESNTRALGTKRRYVEVVEDWWSWCYDHDDRWPNLIPRPRRLDSMPEPPADPVIAPTWDDMDRAIAAVRKADVWVRRVMIFMRFTGLRISQALRIRWDDVDMVDARLTVRGDLGKTRSERKGRVVPISRHLVDEMAGWGVREGLVIERRDPKPYREARARSGRPVKPEGTVVELRAHLPVAHAWERSGVRRDVWFRRPDHAFRKGFQTGLTALGASTEAIEYLVGHSLPGMREVYVEAWALALQAAVDMIPPLTAGVPVVFPRAKKGSGRPR